MFVGHVVRDGLASAGDRLEPAGISVAELGAAGGTALAEQLAASASARIRIEMVFTAAVYIAT
jgi:hypothetical protein